MVLPSVYVIALGGAYGFSSVESVKYIPTVLSVVFLFVFIDAHFNKRETVLGFARKFYPRELASAEVEYLKNADGYWAIVMCINTFIHLYIVNFTSDVIWAFYSSVGWYIYFFIALSIQIIYGKVFGVRMYSR